MVNQWETQRALIVVKTYPTPAWKGGEVVCTAGITEDGDWIRLFPIPFRLLETDQKFGKYQWIKAQVIKATSDVRPESYKVDIDSIELLKPVLTTERHWQGRKNVVYPLAKSMCSLRKANIKTGAATLGFVRPRSIEKLSITGTSAEWSAAESARLNQLGLLVDNLERLEKIPFTFRYEFHCEDDDCPGHKMSCTDWEMAQSYRSWRKKYGSLLWEKAFRETYERRVKERFDTGFFVGTVHGHPHNWVIVGLFLPTKAPPAEGTQQTML